MRNINISRWESTIPVFLDPRFINPQLGMAKVTDSFSPPRYLKTCLCDSFVCLSSPKAPQPHPTRNIYSKFHQCTPFHSEKSDLAKPCCARRGLALVLASTKVLATAALSNMVIFKCIQCSKMFYKVGIKHILSLDQLLN